MSTSPALSCSWQSLKNRDNTASLQSYSLRDPFLLSFPWFWLWIVKMWLTLDSPLSSRHVRSELPVVLVLQHLHLLQHIQPCISIYSDYLSNLSHVLKSDMDSGSPVGRPAWVSNLVSVPIFGKKPRPPWFEFVGAPSWHVGFCLNCRWYIRSSGIGE